MIDNFEWWSGGQYGADLGALHAARDKGVKTNGRINKGFKVLTPNGKIWYRPQLAEFNLLEIPETDFPSRTRKNIELTEATLLIGNASSRGSQLAIRLCGKLNKPLLINWSYDKIAQEIIDNNWSRVNVAGNRQIENDNTSYCLSYAKVFNVSHILRINKYIP